MFFIPSRMIRVSSPKFPVAWTKSNLSKTGKLYPRRPSLSYLGKSFHDHRLFVKDDSPTANPYNYNAYLAPVLDGDWLIEEVD
jgi:hypothetical protein